MVYSEEDLAEIDKSPDRRRAYFWRIAQRLKLEGEPWEKELGEFILQNIEYAVKHHEVGP